VRVDRKEQGFECGLVGSSCGERNFFFAFSSKNAGFYAFVLRKTIYLWPKPGPGGVIDPLGAEDVKRMGC